MRHERMPDASMHLQYPSGYLQLCRRWG